MKITCKLLDKIKDVVNDTRICIFCIKNKKAILQRFRAAQVPNSSPELQHILKHCTHPENEVEKEDQNL